MQEAAKKKKKKEIKNQDRVLNICLTKNTKSTI